MIGKTVSQHFCIPRLFHLDSCSLLSFPVDVLAPFCVFVWSQRKRNLLGRVIFPLWQAVWCTNMTIPRQKLVLFFLSASLWCSFFLKGLLRWVCWGINICWYRWCIVFSCLIIACDSELGVFSLVVNSSEMCDNLLGVMCGGGSSHGVCEARSGASRSGVAAPVHE